MTFQRLSLKRGFSALLLGTILTGCGAPTSASLPSARPSSTPLPAASPTAATQPIIDAQPSPTSVPVIDAQPSDPAFAFEPHQGQPGTVVALRGWGFAANTPVSVGIGFPSLTGPALTTVTADSRGAWKTQISVPDVQPSPKLDWSRMHLIVMNAQGTALASAPFSYIAASSPATPLPGPTREAASQTVRDLLSTFGKGGDIAPYLATTLRDELAGSRTLDEALGLRPTGLASFEVSAPEDRPSEVLFVPVTLRYPDVTEERSYTLVVENGGWRVNGSSLVRMTPTK